MHDSFTYLNIILRRGTTSEMITTYLIMYFKMYLQLINKEVK